jgi:hypothetical protein
MNPDLPTEEHVKTHERHVPSHLPGNKLRRMVDTSAVIVVHLAIVGLVVWTIQKQAEVLAVLGIFVLIADLACFFSPDKYRTVRDRKPESGDPAPTASVGSFALELFVLLAPPIAFITWLQFLIWQHQTLTRNELIVVVIAMPAIVGLVSWIIKARMTRRHVGIVNQTTKFIAFSMLGTWILSTFFFVLFLGALLMKFLEP